MTTDRIKEIQSKTAYPNSVSVQQALLQVWNECEQEQLRIANVSKRFSSAAAIKKLRPVLHLHGWGREKKKGS